MNYKIIINEETIIESDLANLDIVSTNHNDFHVLQNGKAFKASLEEADFKSKNLTIKVNGNKYQLKIQDEYDQLVKKMGLSVANNNKITDIKAPMPGLVLDIMVEAGQTITKGEPLLILEAMKMENVLKSAGEGTVKSIVVEKGNAVEKGQIMIEMA